MHYMTSPKTLNFLKENFGERLKFKLVHDKKLIQGPWIDFTPGSWKYAWYKVHAWTLTDYEVVKNFISFFFFFLNFLSLFRLFILIVTQ
jgi:hypothetical protein